MSEHSTSIPAPPPSAWSPLSHPVFRMLWAAWFMANVSMWMNDVAAAWMMTSLSESPAMVALVQTASTLPVFLLGVPSGALADILDRRQYFMGTQFWVAGVALLLAAVSMADGLTAPLLLLLTFLNGLGLAMRWPVFAAIVPSVVPRPQLPAALALNGIAMNGSRILGPLVAGAVLAALGSEYVFLLNALLSVVAGALIWRWKSEPVKSTLPGERFVGAIRVGLQYVRQSPRMHRVLLRVALFFLQATALLALLPLIARQPGYGGAASFTLLLACLGAGAIFAASMLPRVRARYTVDRLIRDGTILQALAAVAVAHAPGPAWAVLPMFCAGMAWITVANSLTVQAQLALPDWVRARGMSIYQMALMGGSAAGAALWGQVTSWTSLRTALVAASVYGIVAWWVTRRVTVGGKVEEDLSPARAWAEPVTAFPVSADEGPVVVMVSYRIDPARADDFIAVMDESRRSRLRHGVLSWELLRDTTEPGLFVETLLEESWADHLRRFERMTAAEVLLRDRKNAFHLGPEAPKVTRYVGQPVVPSRSG